MNRNQWAIVVAVQAHPGKVTPWELRFVNDIARLGPEAKLTQKQAPILESLGAKVPW